MQALARTAEQIGFRCSSRPSRAVLPRTTEDSGMAKSRPTRPARAQTAPPPQRPRLEESGGRFLQLEREVEQEFARKSYKRYRTRWMASGILAWRRRRIALVAAAPWDITTPGVCGG